MNTDRRGLRRWPLALCALFATTFALTMVVVAPVEQVRLPAPVVQRLWPQQQVADAPMVQVNATQMPASPVPAPTLQELAADSDPDARREAQALRGLINGEAVTD